MKNIDHNQPVTVHAETRAIPTFPVRDVTDLDIAFPGNVSHLMPAPNDIPREFSHAKNMWNRFFNDMFYSGILTADLRPRDGIDPQKALRHIRAIAGSFQPQHEHKEAAVAYLMSQWFTDDSTWVTKGR